ncbi:hypothetical protein KUC85_24830 [Pseudomonas aeruginosa]|uniref:hypothetical protein n=1 Tax=Pseudomonas aeruginosa TaxID=287 RepID=UPI0021E1A96A|nr:hypothetical protein [Pseudomonas aeruginosa]MCV0031870.1 hypothetical protein [Pseudomonas aeruginosa]
MNYPVNPDLMPALMAVFQHVRTRIQSELDCQRLLTDEGLAIHQHAEAIMSRVHDELFAPLTPEEQATLVHLLDQCLAAQPLEDI